MKSNKIIFKKHGVKTNDKAERLAGNAMQPESSVTKSLETVNPQAGGQFVPAPLFGESVIKIDDR